MRFWLRTLTVWLLALALPVQAIAVAGMAHCGPSHQRMHVVQADAQAHSHAGHEKAAGGGEHHHHHDAAATATTVHDLAQADNITDLGAYKCSACASCCAGFALPSAMPKLVAPEFVPTVFAAVELRVDRFAADGLERPPRIDLA